MCNYGLTCDAEFYFNPQFLKQLVFISFAMVFGMGRARISIMIPQAHNDPKGLISMSLLE